MKRSYDKLNPRMASTPGFEPGPHWWEARALTTAAPLLLHAGEISCGFAKYRLFSQAI